MNSVFKYFEVAKKVIFMFGIEVQFVEGNRVGVDSIENLAVGNSVGAQFYFGVVSFSYFIEPGQEL